MTTFTESTIEWLKDLGYTYAFGPEIAFDGEAPERVDYHEALLPGRLRKINDESKEKLNEPGKRTPRQERKLAQSLQQLQGMVWQPQALSWAGLKLDWPL